ncbi:MAG: OFA family MFS transporter [Acidobacteriia bacterium]|nr:OFA family MFS transporter [Terriglobia bacterium]
MASERLPNRWGIAVAAVIMQICLGAVYGWSVFKIPLMRTEHWSETQVQLNFTLAIFFLGVGTIIGGLWQDRKGPRLVASVAGLVYGVGYMLAGVFTADHNMNGLYLAYGVLTGLGMGMGYICPVATLVKWFPERRGLMTGVAVCGYGAGALVMSPIAARLIIAHSVPYTFWALGVVYLVMVVAAAQFYANPPDGWKPAGWTPTSAVAKAATTYSYSVKEAIGTGQFWLLWLLLFLNVSAGIMVISQASPRAQQMVGMTAIAAASMVGLISIFNGLGRVFWAWVSDHLGRARVYFLLYLIQVVIFFSLPKIHNLTLFSLAFAVIGLCYGGGFGTMPSFTADFFGPKYMGGIYGIILLAWGAAAIPSPIMIARLHQATGRFDASIYVIAVVMAVSLVFPLIAKRPRKKELTGSAVASAA